MKLNNAHRTVLLLALLVGLASCTESELGKDNTAGTEDAYISMNLVSSTMSAGRALTDAQINAWENRVNEIWMLLYNDKNTLEKKFTWKVQNYTENSPLQLVNFHNKENDGVVVAATATTTSFTSAAQMVKRQDYRIAVLANPDHSLFKDLVEGSELALLQQAIGDSGQGLSVSNFGSYADDPSASKPFFMSNANGLVKLTKASMYSTEKEAEAAPVTIYLDRLLAKVSVKEKEGGVETAADIVMDSNRPLKWYLDVINKKTFPIRSFAPLMGGTIMETENNSLTTNRERIYGEDPNFRLAENAEDYFSKWRNGDNPPYATWKSEDYQDPSLRTYQYTFENTMDLATQRSDNWGKFTTCIMLNAYLIYKNLLIDPANLDNDDDPGRCYYSCVIERRNKPTQWRVFTHEQVKHWLQAGFPTSADADTNEILQLMEQKVKSVQKDYDNSVADAFNFKAATAPGKEDSHYRSYKGITYHPLGLNKYCSPIRHFPAGTSANPRREVYGYYGVVRNNWYTLTVNSISGPGTGIYDWDNRFFSAEIHITPWYRRDFQEEDLH